MSNEFIIAIDGPSSSGKGTIAKKIADQLKFIYLDTGAMYRALTYYALEHDVDMKSEADLLAALQAIEIDFTNDGRTLINGTDVSEEIRTDIVSKNVSAFVSQYESVRELMVKKQQEMSRGKQIVIDGRDIGTVVFPNAQVKLFISASLPVRAKRRYSQNKEKGSLATYEEMEAMLAHRDRTDIGRAISPLRLAKDSIVLDSTNLNVEETLKQALAHINI